MVNALDEENGSVQDIETLEGNDTSQDPSLSERSENPSQNPRVRPSNEMVRTYTQEQADLERRTLRDNLQELEAESLAGSLPEGFAPEKAVSIVGKQNIPQIIHATHRSLPILLCITNGAVFGVLARKGLIALTTYDGSFVSGVIWANFAACFVMGLCVDSSSLWNELLDSEYFSQKGSIPVYIGLTTGFCGTLLSFSSVMLEVFYKSANVMPGKFYNYPNAAYGILECLTTTAAHFSLAVSGFHMGRHLMELDRFLPALHISHYKVLDITMQVFGVIDMIIVIVLICVMDKSEWRSWMFSCLFAPFGAITRYYLSKYLNGKVPGFPLGTYAANLVGTLLLNIFVLLARGVSTNKHSQNLVRKVINCHVLVGLDDGFCGALTTVSTLVVELFGLRTLHSYRYGFLTIVSSYIVCILILGSYTWSVGLKSASCT